MHCSVWGTLEEQLAADLRRYSYQELSTALAQRGIVRKRGRKEDLVNLLTELVVQVSLPLRRVRRVQKAGWHAACVLRVWSMQRSNCCRGLVVRPGRLRTHLSWPVPGYSADAHRCYQQ